MSLKALIFDGDGTLADTEEAHRAAFNRAFEQQRLAWHWSAHEYTQLVKVTGGKERINAYVDSSVIDAAERRKLLAQIPSMQYQLSESVQSALRDYIALRAAQPSFANARSVRNALDRARLRQASRVVASAERSLTREDLMTIKGEDIRASRAFT